jgi:hypothetical protein
MPSKTRAVTSSLERAKVFFKKGGLTKNDGFQRRSEKQKKTKKLTYTASTTHIPHPSRDQCCIDKNTLLK